MASLGGEQQLNSTKDLSDSIIIQKGNRPTSVEKKDNSAIMEHQSATNSTSSTIHWFAQIGDEHSSSQAPVRDREEKLRIAKERQNEERQRKIEELKVQAEAAQRFREQKEEERKRRIEELRHKDNDRRHQVEERKRAIMEAEKERRDYILRKNQERQARLESKRKNERSSIAFAFGSSTPRLLDPTELGSVSPSTFWGHRRSTSITNVAYTGASLTRRSSERDLADGSKKRAVSAGGIDRQNGDDRRRKSTSMYEVFNWGCTNDEPPKRLQLSIAASEIDIDGPPIPLSTTTSSTTTTPITTTITNSRNLDKDNKDIIKKEDTIDTPIISYRSVARRKTDLMPTIPSPRDTNFGSKSSLSHTPRTPGRAISMTRLDQLSQPMRRYGEHIRAIAERERQQQLEEAGLFSSTDPYNSLNSPTTTIANTPRVNKNMMSRSMCHLAGGNSRIATATRAANLMMRPLRKMDASKSSRSGEVTPGGSINTSRPGSAMSTSTTASGLVQRRSAPPTRKPRPASIAVTGVSLIDDVNKHKKDKPPLPKIQNTPKRSTLNNANGTPRVSSAESSNKQQTDRKPIPRKDSTPQKSSTNLMTQSMDHRVFKTSTPLKTVTSAVEKVESTKDEMTTKAEATTVTNSTVSSEELSQTKEEKNALNAVKTEEEQQKQEQPEGNVLQQENQEQQQKQQERPPTEGLSTLNEEKVDVGSEKSVKKEEIENMVTEKSNTEETRELSVERLENEMTASMMARKITTEEEAKAALAERRRLAREEAERQAELERQRLEAERQEELRRQAEEEEKQRKLEEESIRLAQEQRKAEEERLKQAIEEAQKREEAEKLKREEEERLRQEREEAERKAKEEAEKQRLEIAERLKREEKEREERRKRVEAIMSRTRAKGGAGNNPNSTPSKDNEKQEIKEEKPTNEKENENNSETPENEISNDGSIPVPNIIEQSHQQHSQDHVQQEQEQFNPGQTTYEQSVTDKENALMKSFTNMIIDENVKNLQNFPQQQQQNPFLGNEVTNGSKIHHQEIVSHTIANGNGHIENLNKNETNNLINILPTSTTDQLIDLGNESQQINNDAVNNFNNNINNNNLLTTSTTLVTADSHENKEISLL